MKTDNIKEIGIDDEGRLFIRPEKEQFHMIWRSATEVHWDNDGFLYSPKPRDWSYLDWYKHIVAIAEDYGCKLVPTARTRWSSIPDELRNEIVAL